MKSRKLITIIASVMLALGLCPLIAYADLTAGTQLQTSGETESGEGNEGAPLMGSILNTQSDDSHHYDSTGKHVFTQGERLSCEDEVNEFKYEFVVVVPDKEDGSPGVAALVSIEDISSTKDSLETNGTIDFTVPGTLTYTYTDGVDSSYSSTFAITQLGKSKDESNTQDYKLSIASNIKRIYVPNTVTTLYRFDNSNYLQEIVFANDSAIWEIPENFLASGAHALTSVVLPDSVERIGKNAFSGYNSAYSAYSNYCPALSSVTMPANLETIGDMAFFNCYQLKTADLSRCVKLKSIGEKAFYNTALETLGLPSSLETIGNGAFAWSVGGVYSYGSDWISIPGPTFSSVVIPASVTDIGDFAFASARPKSNSATSENERFEYIRSDGGTRLTTLTFAADANLKRIGDYAFAGSSIASLVLPASLRIFGTDGEGVSHAFYDCRNLASVAFNESNEKPAQLQVLGGFGNCTALERFYMPITSVNEISSRAFEGCTSLITLKLTGDDEQPGLSFPISVEYIGEYAFSGCSAFENVGIPGSIAVIGEGAFSGSSIKSLAFQKGVKTIGQDAFRNCAQLATVELPKGLKTIDDGAFSDCLALTSIEIPATVSRIGKNAFNPKTSLGTYYPIQQGGLTSLTIKPGYTNLVIESGAFLGCTGLSGSTIVLPERVTKLGGGAFLYAGRGVTYEIHNPSIEFTPGEGYMGANLTEDDARIFSDVEPDEEDGLCFVQIPDPWVASNTVVYKNQQTLSGKVTNPAVVKYPNTMTKKTSPTATVYFEELNRDPDAYRPSFQAVDPSTFQEEVINPEDEIEEVAPAGRLQVRTTGPAGSNAYVCVYGADGELAASGQSGRGLAIIEGLTPGTYTVTAFAKNAGFKAVDKLDNYAALGLESDEYAKKTNVVIANGQDTVLEGDNALNVPELMAIATSKDYIKSSSVAVAKKDIYKDTQFFATFNFAMNAGKKASNLELKVPQGLVITSVSSANKTYEANVNARTYTVALDAADQSSGRLYVGMKASKTGTFTLNTSLVCDSKTFPAGSATVTCNAISIELPQAAIPATVETETVQDGDEQRQVQYMRVEEFTVDVYAAPNTDVNLQCANWAGTAMTNRSGHAEVKVNIDKLESALSYASVVAAVQDDDTTVSAQGTVQFAVEQRDPYTLKEFSFVHANQKYDIVRNGKPLSRSSYYTYVANGKEANKYWSFEAVYLSDKPLWIGGRASAVMQNVSCTLQVQMLDGSSRYEKMALLGSDQQDDGSWLNTFATTLYLDQAGDHVFPTSLIPTAFGVSLYAPEETSKPFTQPDIDSMRIRLYEPLEVWTARVDREKKKTLNSKHSGWFSDPSSYTAMLDEDFSEILFYTRSYIWEVYEDACAHPEAYNLDEDQATALQNLVDGGNRATKLLSTLFDASLSAQTSISECGSMFDWLGKNANFKSGQDPSASDISKLADSGWNVTTDNNAPSATGNGGTPTGGFGTPNATFAEPKSIATRLNKDSNGNIKSMSYRDSNGNSATFNKPFDSSVNNKYNVDWFNTSDFANLLGTAFSTDNLKNGSLFALDASIDNALKKKLGEAKFNKLFPSGTNASFLGFGFAQGLSLGQTAIEGYKQHQASLELIEAFKDADKARDIADNLNIRVNKMIKSGEWKNNSKCFKALKEERDWAIIVADALKTHAQLSEVESWRNLGMTAGSGLAGVCSGGLGTGVMYVVDKTTGKIMCNEMNSNQGILGPAMRNYLAAHRQRMIDCGETEDDAPFAKPAILDPSGVVYEAFPDNPLEGVQATVYEFATQEGASQPTWNVWKAEEYDQESSQTTGKDGAFSWDVPVGKWKVGFTKAGYVAAETAPMEVPPPRMGLLQPMVAEANPTVKSATSDTKSIEITFDQYMDASAMPNVVVNGSTVTDGEWVDVVEWDGKKFAKVLRIPAPSGTKTGDSLNVQVSNAKNYASKDLAQTSKSVTVAPRPTTIKFNFDDTISMKAGTSRATTVRVYDGDGKPMQGLKLTAELDNAFLAQVDATNAITDANGTAKLQITTSLPGMSELTVGVQGAELKRTINLRTTADTNQPERPTAKLGSTSLGVGAPFENAVTVAEGTKLELSCSTEGATIYYTTDGSCPCQDTPARKTYTGPITITQNTNFIVASYKSGMDYSERMKINVTVKKASPKPDPSGGNTNGNVSGDTSFNQQNVAPEKSANTMVAKGKTLKVKYSKVKKKSLSFKAKKAFKITNANGAVTFKKVKGNKKIKVAKSGKVTVKKGLKKGTYKVKVRVTAAGDENYNALSKVIAIKVKVK